MREMLLKLKGTKDLKAMKYSALLKYIREVESTTEVWVNEACIVLNNKEED